MSEQYKKAGVDIDAGARAVALMRDAVRETYSDQVLSDVGNFGGLFSLLSLKNMAHPVMVASTDGVGTKTRVAAKLKRWDTIGQDLVNHCINDILVQGAEPLFFMDYVASDKLDEQQIATIVSGMAKACKEAGIALLGGETAEMPGVYASGEVDVVGTIVGAVDYQAIIDGKQIRAGDRILALPSSGLHTNGFTLARSVLAYMDWEIVHPELNQTLGDALLAVHRCYLHEIRQLREKVTIRGLAHLTGGGLIDNLPRVLPEGLGAEIRRDSWEIPTLFQLIQARGNIAERELFRVFNMGLGMLIVVRSEEVQMVLDTLEDAFLIGEIVAKNEGVQLV